MINQGIEIEQRGPVVTARIQLPEVSHLQMQEIVDECLEHVRIHNGRHVLLDLSGVEFLSSACLGPIVALLQDLEHVRGRLAVCNCRENVAFLLKVTRLDSVMSVFEDEAQARASF